MADQLQLRGGTTAEHSTFTGALREVTVDTDKDTLVVHDNATVGGRPLMREDGSNSALSLGSASAPSIKFTGDPNTGIYSPGADQVALATGGTGRLFVDASGNVAVGSSSFGTYSDRAFSLYSTTNPSIKLSNATTGSTLTDGIEVILSGSDGYLWNRENAAWIFGTNNIERMRLTATGLGIGTSAPGAKLSVQGGQGGISNPANGTIDVIDETTAALGVGGQIVFRGQFQSGAYTQYGAITAYKESATVDGSQYGASLIFNTRTQGGNNTEKMRLDSSGRLGIGTTSPTATLDVSADTMRLRTAKTPASATATGNAGDICWDANYVYVCTATNTWKRSALSTW